MIIEDLFSNNLMFFILVLLDYDVCCLSLQVHHSCKLLRLGNSLITLSLINKNILPIFLLNS